MKRPAAKLKTALLAGAVAALVLCSSVGSSMSYFTTYVTAKGSRKVHVEMTTPGVHEEHEGATKVITAQNTGERECYVRVKYFAPEGIPCTENLGTGWFDGGDGYWYYSIPLLKGESSSQMNITPTNLDLVEEDFNIEVIVESAPVFYDEDGNKIANGPEYKGWTETLKESEPVTGAESSDP